MCRWHWWRERKIFPPTHTPLFLETGRKREQAERWARRKIPRGAAGRQSFCNNMIYCFLFTVYCSVERMSKCLYGKKKIEKNKHVQNANENFVQHDQDALEMFSIWRFNGQQPGTYGQSSFMVLFLCLFFKGVTLRRCKVTFSL